MNYELRIMHIDMDAFFAAIEERDNPQFQGRPIVVGADPNGGNGRGVVSTANYEARKYGIKSALPISVAWRLCPTAIFLPVDGKRYQRVSGHIMELIRPFGEKMEQVSVDEAYLVISDKQKVISYKKAEGIAKKIKKEIKTKERLTCSIGIGPNKLVAKIASGYRKPDGLTIIEPHKVQDFLDPKPAKALPGVGPKTSRVLQEKWNVETVADLRKISQDALTETLGKNGIWLWQIARGIDDRPIEEEREIKSVGRQTTFEEDTNDSRVIVKTIFDLLEETLQELEERDLAGKTLTVIVRYRGFETHSSQESTKEKLTLENAKKLCLKLLLPYFNGGRKIRLVGVRISGF
ncbi:MAG: DNA polymerase IV [Candidatus Blackburnbacteria bacterium]|nr:DNA polymerase IV [Candidatus Blackburnbacteria bacterium]